MSDLTPEENATFEELALRAQNMKVIELSGEEGIKYIESLPPEIRAALLDQLQKFLNDVWGDHDD